MKEYIIRHEVSLPNLTWPAVFAAGIVVLLISVSIMRKHVAYSSTPSHSEKVESLSLAAPSRTQSSLRIICFVRGPWIYVKNLVSGAENRLVQGLSPHLSPTGESVAFISVKENEGIMNTVVPPPGRLRVLNLRTRNVGEFDFLRDCRVGSPIWSNDGKKLAVTIGCNAKSPSIAVLNVVSGKLEKEITGGGIPSDDGIYIDSWTPDDRSLLFHSLSALYEVNITDAVVQRLPVGDLFKLGEISSATRFSFSLDRRYLLFDKTIDTPTEPETEVISVFDLQTKALLRVTPHGIRGRAPLWLPSNKEILFTRVEWLKGKWRSNICKVSLDGTGLTTLARNADFVSYATR